MQNFNAKGITQIGNYTYTSIYLTCGVLSFFCLRSGILSDFEDFEFAVYCAAYCENPKTMNTRTIYGMLLCFK